MVPNCKCHACTDHTKNYICHLLNNTEMLGFVLLTIHNCHVYQDFFNVLNSNGFKENPEVYVKTLKDLYSVKTDKLDESGKGNNKEVVVNDDNGQDGDLGDSKNV